jgi:hypothetical protein
LSQSAKRTRRKARRAPLSFSMPLSLCVYVYYMRVVCVQRRTPVNRVLLYRKTKWGSNSVIIPLISLLPPSLPLPPSHTATQHKRLTPPPREREEDDAARRAQEGGQQRLNFRGAFFIGAKRAMGGSASKPGNEIRSVARIVPYIASVRSSAKERKARRERASEGGKEGLMLVTALLRLQMYRQGRTSQPISSLPSLPPSLSSLPPALAPWKS